MGTVKSTKANLLIPALIATPSIPMEEYEPIIKDINPNMVQDCVKYLKTHNMANRGIFDGSKQDQLIGLVGEMETHYLLKGEYQDLKIKKNEFDGGVDIVHNKDTYDVKTMARTVYTKIDFVNNFAKCQEDYKCDRIIFTSINKTAKQIEFCGWIYKNELPLISDLIKKGDVRERNNGTTFIVKEDMYEIPMCELRDIRLLLD